MKDTPKIGDSLKREYSEKEKYQCSTPHTPHTLHNKEKRYPINVRIRRSVHDSFIKYCAYADMTVGQFYEEAGILFMDLNPVDGTILVVEKNSLRDSSIKDRMLNMICIQELQEFVPVLKRSKEEGFKLHRVFLDRLRKTFDKCYKVGEPTEELNRLIEEALEYIE